MVLFKDSARAPHEEALIGLTYLRLKNTKTPHYSHYSFIYNLKEVYHV